MRRFSGQRPDKADCVERTLTVIAFQALGLDGEVNRLHAAVSSSDAATSVAPAFASNFAWLEFGSRVTARTLWPRSRRPRATAPPCLPVDPVTTTVSSCAMFWFLSPDGHDLSDVSSAGAT